MVALRWGRGAVVLLETGDEVDQDDELHATGPRHGDKGNGDKGNGGRGSGERAMVTRAMVT